MANDLNAYGPIFLNGKEAQSIAILVDLGKPFLQVRYDCNPQDQQNLDELQKQMQQRISFLEENDMDTYGDPQLLESYELHAHIQQCLFQDHTDQYLFIAGIIAGISLFVYFRWWMVRRSSSKKKLN